VTILSSEIEDTGPSPARTVRADPASNGTIGAAVASRIERVKTCKRLFMKKIVDDKLGKGGS
jgi:hypothetical protein